MKSLYAEEIPLILNLLDQGIKQRIEDCGPDETVGLLEFIREKITVHNGEYIRIPKIPFDLEKIDTIFILDLFHTGESEKDFYRYLMDQNWTERFNEFIGEDGD